jgi:hypothetical protein
MPDGEETDDFIAAYRQRIPAFAAASFGEAGSSHPDQPIDVILSWLSAGRSQQNAYIHSERSHN